MKKKIGIVLSMLLGLSALGLGMYHTSASQTAPELSEKQIKQLVEDQYPGKITEFELDKEGNRTVYEVEVEKDGKEYDIVFDGNTGEVLSLEKQLISKDNDNDDLDDNDDSDDQVEKDDDKSAVDSDERNDSDDAKSDKDDSDEHSNNGTKANNDNNDKNVKEEKNDKKNADKNNETSRDPRISAAKAQEIALKEVPGTVISSELDEDDGRLIYEIEIKSDKKEAEFEINAYTGEIIVMSIDKFENDNDYDDNANEDQNETDNDPDNGNDAKNKSGKK